MLISGFSQIFSKDGTTIRTNPKLSSTGGMSTRCTPLFTALWCGLFSNPNLLAQRIWKSFYNGIASKLELNKCVEFNSKLPPSTLRRIVLSGPPSNQLFLCRLRGWLGGDILTPISKLNQATYGTKVFSRYIRIPTKRLSKRLRKDFTGVNKTPSETKGNRLSC